MTIVTQQNLKIGIKHWLDEKAKWPRDFHNSFYHHLYELHQLDFSDKWLSTMIDNLWGWRATRPKTKAYIQEHTVPYLVDIKHIFNKLTSTQNLVSISTVTWEEAKVLFEIAHDIKGVDSPVFASKFSHFLFPAIYPVIDQEVMGGSHDYAKYWVDCRNWWLESSETVECRYILEDQIVVNSDKPVIETYPWETKILELCFIGARNS